MIDFYLYGRKYSNFHIYVYMTQQKFNKFSQIND